MNPEIGQDESVARAERPAEAELVDRVRRRDPRAFGHLYRTYAGSLHTIVLGITASRPDADDVVQDVFAALPRAIRTYEGRGSFWSWLRRQAVTRALMLVRDRRIRREVPLTDHSAWPRRLDTAVLDAIEMQRALGALPDRLRAVVVLREQGYTHKEVGELLDITPATSALFAHRARERLRKLLGRPS